MDYAHSRLETCSQSLCDPRRGSTPSLASRLYTLCLTVPMAFVKFMSIRWRAFGRFYALGYVLIVVFPKKGYLCIWASLSLFIMPRAGGKALLSALLQSLLASPPRNTYWAKRCIAACSLPTTKCKSKILTAIVIAVIAALDHLYILGAVEAHPEWVCFHNWCRIAISGYSDNYQIRAK